MSRLEPSPTPASSKSSDNSSLPRRGSKDSLWSQLWGVNARPSRLTQILMGLVPFALLLTLYCIASDLRHKENPDDKLLPTLTQMLTASQELAFEVDSRTGVRLLWTDTSQSLIRLAAGVGAAALTGLTVGLFLGVFGGWRATFLPFVTFLAIVPPLALLPILFIVFGVDELAKIILIFIGTCPLMIRDIYGEVSQLPAEQKVKSLTLGAKGMSYLYRIVMPQVLPRLLETMRLSLGAAWLFLIASEAIAAEAGLGYRIFLVRRYLSMDIIIPYALWITFLGFSMDLALRRLNTWLFPWYAGSKTQ